MNEFYRTSILPFLEYLEKTKNFSHHTILAYKTDWEQFIESCQVQELKDIDHSLLQEYLKNLAKMNVAKSTLHRKASSFRSFYTFLQKKKEHTQNPALLLKIPKIPKKIPSYVRQTELESFFEKPLTKKNYRELLNFTLFVFLIYTGARRAEIIECRLEQLDFQKQTIKLFGKGKKERIIPMLKPLKKVLEAYLNSDERKQMPSEYLFYTNTKRPLYPKYIFNSTQNILENMSRSTKKSPHVLRHTFATLLLQNGADLNSIKSLLGHSSLASTQIYAQADIKLLKETHQKAHPQNKNQAKGKGEKIV